MPVKVRLSDSVDLMSFHGAGILAEMIENYWHEWGHTNVKAYRVEISHRITSYGVKSNLVNGLPPRKKPK